jgi:3-oxoadipate enol-lactonase
MNIQTKHIESLIEHKVLKMDGYDIHYYVSGKENSDLLVFLHPAFSDHRAFTRQIEFFLKNIE